MKEREISSRIHCVFRDITRHARTGRALRQRNRELDLLNKAQESLNSTLELDWVLTAVLDEVRLLLNVIACSIWLIDTATGELVCRQLTEPQSQVVRGWRLAPGRGIAGWVVANGHSLVIADAQLDERHFKGVDQKTKLLTRSLLCVPLRVKRQIIGVVQVIDSEVDRFQQEDLALIESLASTAAVAIENARLHKRLAKHAAEMERRVVERTRELVVANEQLKELDRLKTKLIEDISHELRTPVTNLSLYLDLLEQGQTDKRDHYLVILREKINQLVHMTEDALDIFRLDLFKGDVVFEPLALNEVVAEVMALHRRQVEKSGLALLFEPGADLPPLLAEPKQLRQVVKNLLDNAINYTPAGSVQISTYFDAEREQVCLDIKDTGIGVSPEERPYIFERFYRGQGVAQSNIPGTGLGLAVVKDIVALHNGEVLVTSKLDEGSLFSVRFPAVLDEQI